jgi:membrane protease subunit HflC
MNRTTIAGIALLVVLAIVASASLFTVTQTEQVLVVQFGKVVRPIESPGLQAKWPIAQNIISFDKRIFLHHLRQRQRVDEVR